MAIKDFINNKIESVKLELQRKEEIRKADADAYYQARIDGAEKKAEQKVKQEIKDMKQKPTQQKQTSGFDAKKTSEGMMNWLVGDQSKQKKQTQTPFDFKI